MMRIILLCFGLFIHQTALAAWKDLWKTADQQAAVMMKKGQYKQALDTFQRQDWIGAAAYRAGDYKQAAESFALFPSEQGFYNLGNALAHQGAYEQAIAAYDKVLVLNPKNEDAIFNRQLLKDLMKKDKEKQQQRQKDENNQDKNQNAQKQKSKKQDQQDQQEQNKDQQPQEQDQDAKTDKKDKKKKQEEQQLKKQQQEKQQQEKPQEQQTKASQSKQEEQAAKQQWLKLVPDDPGGLMRQKFLRDYLRKQGGWH